MTRGKGLISEATLGGEAKKNKKTKKQKKTAAAGKCSLAPFKAKFLLATWSRNKRGASLKPPLLNPFPGRVPIQDTSQPGASF